MRRRRLRQQAEAERDERRLGAALRKAQRQIERDARDASSFAAFEQKLIDYGRVGDGPVRDLFVEWFSRGFNSGRRRTNAGQRKPNSARDSKWSRGEFAAKIGYIYREGACEEVSASFLSNMGDDQAGAVGCARVVEDIEGMARDNGGVYKHVVIALPHQLTPEERLALLQEIVRPLRELGLPFCAAPHKPDPNGDRRNFHAHILHSLRPMTRTGPNQWTFAESKLTWFDCREGMILQRRLLAAAFNRALERAGHEARWTSKSRAARGLSSPGNTKKGPERTRAEREAQLAEVAAQEARFRVEELERIALGSEALMSLSDRLEDIFALRMKQRAERDANEPPTWEEELALQERIKDERARADGRPLPTNIFYGIEEPEKDPPAPAAAVSADPGGAASEAADRRREAARLKAEVKDREKQERRERLTELDLQVVSRIERRRILMNDDDAFDHVRCALTGNPTVYCRRVRENLVIGVFSPSLAEYVIRISECEAGRRYLIKMSSELEPWPDVDPPGLHQIWIPAGTGRSTSLAHEQWHRKRRKRGR
jgi:hypothetical protein